MNLDDPKLTAFALGELLPGERAEFEALLRTDAQASAEVAETLEMARILRGGLQAEEGAPLAEHQRDAILRAASLAGLEHRPLETSERPAAGVLLTHASWWNRPGPWQAIAACAVVGFGIYALSFPPASPERSQMTGTNGIEVSLPPVGGAPDAVAANDGNPERPNEVTETPGVKVQNVANQNYGAKPPQVQIPRQTPNTGVKIVQGNEAPFEDRNPQATGNGPRDVEKGVALPSVEKGIAMQKGPKGPTTVDENYGASIGKNNPSRPVVDVDLFLRERIEEAKLPIGTDGDTFKGVFEAVKGVPGHYQMRKYPTIKVKATFDRDGKVVDFLPDELPTLDDKLKTISPPYLEVAK